MPYKFSKNFSIAMTGMLIALIAILTFTPIGFPQIPLIGSATIIHIPVIIGGILLGPKYGAILGFTFGLSSLIFATAMSTALNAFAFTPFRPVPGTDSGSPYAILIAFVPRILVSIVAPLIFMGLNKLLPRIKPITLAIAAFVASMTNTLLVLNLLYLIFREPWSLARSNANVAEPQITYAFITATIAGFGIPEAIAAAVIVPVICLALFTVAKRMGKM